MGEGKGMVWEQGGLNLSRARDGGLVHQRIARGACRELRPSFLVHCVSKDMNIRGLVLALFVEAVIEGQAAQVREDIAGVKGIPLVELLPAADVKLDPQRY